MSERELSQFGVIGLGVMGRNLACNIGDHGFRVAVWNRSQGPRDVFRSEAGDGDYVVADTLAELVEHLERPRRILLLLTAGSAVDAVLEQLTSMVDEGDILIDAGNTWFEDTRRREADLRSRGLCFVGMGVSGGEEGARHGPSLMPGGDATAYEILRPVLESIAAETDAGPCVTHVGPDGAGHFVKMVHNGIEYADMQLICEVYDFLRRGMGQGIEEVAEHFGRFDDGPLGSYLIEITGKILGKRSAHDGQPLIEQVLDRAGQKGTGRWTVEAALTLGVPVPSIAAAVDARLLSSMKSERVAAGAVIEAPPALVYETDPDRIQVVHDALMAGKVCAYAQGLALIRAGSDEYGWGVDLGETARIWKGGCIIRARFLDRIRDAFAADVALPNLLMDPTVEQAMRTWVPRLRTMVAEAQAAGIPVPALASSLAYFDSYRTADLPQNLIQAQRDAFGAHTYQRRDDPQGEAVHSDWLG